jgi:uncharacterized phiE125 gp8 family phage protein
MTDVYPIRTLVLDSSDAGLPIPLAEAKAAVRVDSAFEDLVLKRKLWTAIETVENRTGLLMRPGTFAISMDAWPECGAYLPWWPFRALEAVSYLPSTGSSVAVDAASYDTRPTPLGQQLYFYSAFGTPALRSEKRGAIQVEFEAGYALAAEASPDPELRLPERVKEAALLLFGHLAKNREAVGDPLAVIPYSTDLLLQELRNFR